MRVLYPTPAEYQSVLADVSIATGYFTIALMVLGESRLTGVSECGLGDGMRSIGMRSIGIGREQYLRAATEGTLMMVCRWR